MKRSQPYLGWPSEDSRLVMKSQHLCCTGPRAWPFVHITGWVKQGKELSYWEHDFKHFANLLLDHLEVDQQSRDAFDGKVARKIEGAKARRMEGLQRSMQDGSLQEMLQQAMRPKIQEYEGGPWRPMTDEELEEEQQFLRGQS
eukprot:s3892_g3.t1